MRTIPHPLKMLRSFRWVFLQISLGLCFRIVCYSQHININDSLGYRSQLAWFDDAIGIENTAIINGTKYTVPFQVVDTHPFYNSAIGGNGIITFDKQPYYNLTLLYDIYSDEVIVQQRRPNGMHALIKPYKADVESFGIHDHTFRNYQGPKAEDLGMVSGFYEVLHENAVFTVVAKRKKNTNVELGRIQYESEDHYFFIHQGKASPFRGMKNFYQVIGEKDLISEPKSYVSKHNLQIKKSDNDLIAVARYCGTILNKR